MENYSIDDIIQKYEEEISRLRSLLTCQVGLNARITAGEIIQIQALIDSLKILC